MTKHACTLSLFSGPIRYRKDTFLVSRGDIKPWAFARAEFPVLSLLAGVIFGQVIHSS